MNFFGKLIFFLCANSPALIIWGIFQYSHNKFLSFFLFLISIFSYIGIFLLFYFAKKKQTKKLFEAKIENNVNSQMLEYMVSYILPFVSLSDINSIETSLALCVYYLILFGIYLKSDIFYINPILNIIGYNIYKINYKDDSIIKTAFLITKQPAFNVKFENNVSQIEKNIFIYNGD